LSQRDREIGSIQTASAFKEWLVENHWFADCHVLGLNPLPSSSVGPPPDTASMVVAYQIQGDYTAHSLRVLRVYRLVMLRVHEYLLVTDWKDIGIQINDAISSTHCSRGIDALDSEDTIAFSIDLPAILTVRCEEATIEQLPNIVETVKPWLSDREVYARVPAARLPTPAQWVELFHEQGEEVAWHIYCEESKAISAVPQDYRGWFLQHTKFFGEGPQGLFFFACSSDKDGFHVTIENSGASHRLWHTAKIILGRFTGVLIRCGNCTLTGTEWIEELNRVEKTN